jgi:hypothetical protein
MSTGEVFLLPGFAVLLAIRWHTCDTPRFCTAFAMLLLMLLAFCRARIAHLRAQGADSRRVPAAAHHGTGCKAADRRAIDVEFNAFGHFGRMFLSQTGSDAVVASRRACVAGRDARLMLFVSI